MKKIVIVILSALSIGSLIGQVVYSTDSIKVESGTTVYMPQNFNNTTNGYLLNNGIIHILGSWTDNGVTPSTASGQVQFRGTTQQVIDGTGTKNFYSILFNNTTAGTQAFKLDGTNLNIYGTATLTDGIIESLSSSQPIFQDNSFVTGTSNASFFRKYVQKLGNDTFNFPIGDSIWYRPAYIGGVSSNSDFTARYFFQNPSVVSSTLGSGVHHISSKEFWRVNGTGNAHLTLTWDTTTTSGEVNSLSDLIIAGSNSGGTWNNFKQKWRIGSPPSGQLTNDSAIGTAWYYFTLASLNILNPLPIDLLSWNANSVDNSWVNCLWTVTNQKMVSHYVIERSRDGIKWEYVGRREALNSGDPVLYYTLPDPRPYMGYSWYRLIQKDLDGGAHKADPRRVWFGEGTKPNVALFPNPGSDISVLSVENARPDAWVAVQVMDAGGKLIYSHTGQGNSFVLPCGKWSEGMYFVRTTVGGETFVDKLSVGR